MAGELTIQEVQGRIRDIEVSLGKAVIASQGNRIWNEACPFHRDGEDFVCASADRQTAENIASNPRIALIIEAANGERVVYSGIATAAHGSELRVSPYRASATLKGDGAGGDFVLERRKLSWQFALPAKDPGEGRMGFAKRIGYLADLSRAVALPLSFIPILVGSVLALPAGGFGAGTFLLVLLGGLSAHLGTNLVSDYNDFRKGVDTSDALSSHPGALVDERLPADRILIGGMACFAFTAFAGGLLTVRAGWPLAVIGFLGILGGWSYTGGKLAYKYRALGELLIGLLMGPLLVFAPYFVLTGSFGILPLVLSLPLGLLVSSVTLSNNMRDTLDDRKAGIRTLPMSLGVARSKALYYAMLGLPYLIVGATAIATKGAWPLLLVVFSLRNAWQAFAAMRDTTDEDDIRAKAAERRYPLKSIQLHLVFGLLLIAGTVLMESGILP
jgi:1,4-dihydroxy-2-naphthoate octaprenyltransferase